MKRILILVLALSTIFMISACDNTNQTTSPITPQLPENDFCGKTVLVVMDQSVGGINKVHEKSFFGEIEEQIVEIIDLSFVIDVNNAKVNVDDFHQILSLKLLRDDKEYVLKVIELLQNIDGIKYASPNYFDKVCQTVPNDPQFGNI